jgi:abhydrolase domain-containing protein 17
MNRFFSKQYLIGEFSFKRIIKSFLFVYFFLNLYAIFWSDHLIFQPHPSSYQDDSSIIKLTTSDGVKISAMYLPNPKATYTILYSHGNGEDMGDVLPILESLKDLNFSFFIYDYHGYGTSSGKPSESHTYQDIDAAYDYLTKDLKISPNQLIVWGRSVGGGPAIDLVSRKPVIGLIAESCFTTAFRVVTKFPLVPYDKFSNLKKIEKIHCQILFIHGRDDEVIPFHHSEILFNKANEPKQCLWVDKANHNNLMWIGGGQSYRKTLKEFIQSLDSKIGSQERLS